MPPEATTKLPHIGEVIAPILIRVAVAQQPLLIAVAERMAALRYRRWAEEIGNPKQRTELLACAAREEDIAARIEALYPEAASMKRELLAANPDLDEVNRTLFARRPLADQFAIQAEGERLGAATWRGFARRGDGPDGRDVFLACAELEEQSAVVLEAILSNLRS